MLSKIFAPCVYAINHLLLKEAYIPKYSDGFHVCLSEVKGEREKKKKKDLPNETNAKSRANLKGSASTVRVGKHFSFNAGKNGYVTESIQLVGSDF